ncbi:hypothetical protein AOLI_G00324610 [Acnodon oligacanthus]
MTRRNAPICSLFPRFKDVKGLIEQDFVLLLFVQELMEATELTVEEYQDEVDLLGWDSDLSSLILLLHLLPPSA